MKNEFRPSSFYDISIMYATTNFCDFDFTKKLKCSTNLGTMRIRITELWKNPQYWDFCNNHIIYKSTYLRILFLPFRTMNERKREHLCLWI